MGVEMLIEGTAKFTPPIPTAAFPQLVADLQSQSFELCQLVVDEHTGGLLLGIDTAGEYGWSKHGWSGVLLALEDLARAGGAKLDVELTWGCDDADEMHGHVVIDDGGRLHLVEEDEEEEPHRTRTCSCLISKADAARIFRGRRRTANSDVTIADVQCGPFTEYQVQCTGHGIEGTYTTPRQAQHMRERHLTSDHAEGDTTLSA